MRNFTLMVAVVTAGSILLAVKLFAWYRTGSNAILADALESIVNLVAGIFAAFAVHQSSKPVDEDHPYGHGKVQFFSSGFEGSLILIAGLISIGRGTYGFFVSHELQSLDLGAWLTAVSLAVNGAIGWFLIVRGKSSHSIAIEADGRHLVSDAFTSLGLLLGLLVMIFIGQYWIDNALSIIFGMVIMYSGYKIMRRSVSGLMDEADFETLENIIKHTESHRKANWVDIHKLRIQKFGDRLHVDVHLTLPYYLSLAEAHDEVKAFEDIMESKHPGRIEAFIHSDPCEPAPSCTVCQKQDCTFRKAKMEQKLIWNLENALRNKKHGH